MSNIHQYIYKLYVKTVNSIAFYPSLIAFTYFLFAFAVMANEYHSALMHFKMTISKVLVHGEDNARLVLGTLVGSIISLMVFSFSMVMLVLSRSSSTLSPRVIPSLVSRKSHQWVLGNYLGTIIYSLIMVVNINSKQSPDQIPSLGILFAMIFGVYCLILFIYFIHSISKSIQTDSILDTIFEETKCKMKEYFDNKVETLPNTDKWHQIRSKQAGYLKQINTNKLLKICRKYDLKIQLTKPVGFFLIEDFPIAKIDNDIDENVEDLILQCFICYPEERLEDHYHFGFKHISEIAIKALSPGINDPGTAIKSIDMLSLLFTKKMKFEGNIGLHEKNILRLIFTEVTLEQMLFINLTPIRDYGRCDANVMFSLLESLKNMIYSCDNDEHINILIDYTGSVVASCDKYIESQLDRKAINCLITCINELLKTGTSLSEISLNKQ
ncbi:MAG: DUF2254 domain-containing protein [Gammaproteobacteria bacterium]|nr:DUF2254 domain-containing protein [Gammaproteobacteria bacterium]